MGGSSLASVDIYPYQEFYITSKHWQEMLVDVDRRAPQEACGLLAGIGQTTLAVFPISNVLKSPVRFRMEPYEQLQALNQIDENNWQLLAIYHSHPNGPAHPSPTDIAEAAYPEAVNLIWSPGDENWRCRGFIIRDQQVYEIAVRISDFE